MRLRAGARTDKGRVRELNEDVFAARPQQGLFVVCDGMGGCPAGEVASQIAAAAIVEYLDVRHTTLKSSPSDESGYLSQTSRLAEAVRRSNQIVYSQAQSDPRKAGMGTTVVTAWIIEHIASVAHVGDSRAYLWHHDHLERLTRDHSLVEARVQAGQLDRETSLHSEQQNILVRVLGREPTVEVDLNEVPLGPGDRLLLCSDGLTRMVSEQTLAEALSQRRDPQQICDDLIAAANRHGGADNITAVVVEVTPAWWRHLFEPAESLRRTHGEPHVAV